MKFITALLATLGASITNATPCPNGSTTSLRQEAEARNILIGSGAINPSYLEDPRFATTLAREFTSLSPENELKWIFVNPSDGVYDWTKLDRLVDFAEEHDMVVKGHGLISGCCNPEYVLNITEPDAMRAAMSAHFEAVMQRYSGKMDRWDVTSEALETMGGGLSSNIFLDVLGPGYIADAFRIAHAADPHARLFLNENQVESIPSKRQELYDLVSGLVADDVPLHGIALQMHITEIPPVPGVITDMVKAYTALGLEVSIAEMDVHTLNDTLQPEIYRAIMKESLAAGITDISFWGFTDAHLYTWLPGAKPLMFDEEYNPKPAYFETLSAVVEVGSQA